MNPSFSGVVPDDRLPVIHAQEPVFKAVVTPDKVPSMHWLDGYLDHDHSPTFDKETITNNPNQDKETFLFGSARSDNHDSTKIDAVIAGSNSDLPGPTLLFLSLLIFLPLAGGDCPARPHGTHPHDMVSLTHPQA